MEVPGGPYTQYFPPVWIISKIGTFLSENFGDMMLRSIATGSGSIFHVTTSDSLRGRGGGLYSDQAGTSLTSCGEPGRCGLTPMPSDVKDEELGKLLWDETEDLLKEMGYD